MDTQQDSTPEDRFGRMMRRRREYLGLTQRELGEKLRAGGVDLHPSAVAKMETRDVASPRVIRLNEAAAVASALELSVERMCAEEAAPDESGEDERQRLFREMLSLTAQYNEWHGRLSQAQRELSELLEALSFAGQRFNELTQAAEGGDGGRSETR